MLLQFGDAGFGDLQALAFEHERLGDDRHGQDAHLARDFGDDRAGAGAGAAAHAGGDEHHVRALERLGNLCALFIRSLTAGFRLGAGAEAGLAETQFLVRNAALQRLRVRVGRQEFNAHHAFANHVIDGVATGAADADHLDHGFRIACQLFFLDDFKHGPLLRKKLSKNKSQKFFSNQDFIRPNTCFTSRVSRTLRPRFRCVCASSSRP